MSLLQNSNAIESGSYTINNSLRFRASASAYLNRTPASAGSQTTWTWSAWVKRGAQGSIQGLFDSYVNSSNFSTFFFTASNTLYFYTANSSPSFADYSIQSDAVFRDSSAWYHIVFVLNTTSATQADRCILYVNGVRQSVNNPDGAFLQNVTTYINSVNAHNLGRRQDGAFSFDGYLAEVNFVDGQALTPSSFGQTDTLTGVWTAKKYTGTYGTNGFYLPFSNTTSATTLAYDASGNGNNWTANNISTTAGVTYDAMIDSPSLGVSGTQPVGNYAVMNPLALNPSYAKPTNGNLKCAMGTSGLNGTGLSTMLMPSGKWYAEFIGSGNMAVGIIRNTQSAMYSVISGALYMGQIADTYSYYGDGRKLNAGVYTAYGTAFTAANVIGVAYDASAGSLTFYRDGVSQGVAFSSLTGDFYIAFSDGSGAVVEANFGQRPFSFTPPTGFVALCTANLPAVAIANPKEHFDVLTWSGDDTSTRNITGLDFTPDFAWAKTRNAAYEHWLWDVVRGVGVTGDLCTSLTIAEGYLDGAVYGYMSAFIQGGFTVVNGSSSADVLNETGKVYVAWNWKANGAGVTNTDGSITSTVSANTTAGFSIVTYTGTGANATVGHGLGVAPKMVIVKRRDNGVGATNWYVYHAGVNGGVNPQQYNLKLNLTSAQAGLTAAWNDTAPTSSVFTVGTSTEINGSGGTFVAYVFSEISGFSKFGSYTGNGSADGPFIYLGFRPKFVMIKGSSLISEWYVWDSARNTYNVANMTLKPNQSAAEYSAGSLLLDLTSNGFKLRDVVGSWNLSGQTYIYMAFAENPFKNALAR